MEAWCTLRVPQPPLSDHAWGGNATGAIYLCTRPAHDGIPDPAMVVTRWVPAAPEAPDPETIAWQILADLDLESPELGGSTVRGTSTWSVTWSGGGQSGTIPLTLSREAEVIIGELQTVNVNR